MSIHFLVYFNSIYCIYYTGFQEEQVMYFENFDLENIQTPVNVDQFVAAMEEADYQPDKIQFLKQGFTYGFDIGYARPIVRQSNSQIIPLKHGSKVQLWNKLMKEVKLKRVAGPFDKIPFNNYIQSPISLVPKVGSDKVRLIFHLSYNFGEGEHEKSLNYHTPKEKCSVKHNDMDSVIRACLRVKQQQNKAR